MLQLPKSEKSAKRSLEHHAAKVHPDHTGDYRELIGQTIIRSRNQGGANTASQTAVLALASVSNAARTRLQLSYRSRTPPAAEPREASLAIFEDISVLTSRMKHARSKISAMLQFLDKNDDNEEKVTIGADAWDRAAVDGKLGEDVHRLAKDAFPTDMCDHQFTVCAASDDFVLGKMINYYTEKVARFESRIADRSA